MTNIEHNLASCFVNLVIWFIYVKHHLVKVVIMHNSMKSDHFTKLWTGQEDMHNFTWKWTLMRVLIKSSQGSPGRH